MKNKIWAKTILSVYRYIDKAIQIIDNTVSKISLIANADCLETANKILMFTERKVWLINLKLIVEQVLAECKTNEIRILGLKHIDNLSVCELSEYFQKCERTIFRQLNSAYDNFEKNMLKRGFNDKYFVEHFSSEKWINKEYEKIKEMEEVNSEKKKTKHFA